MRFTGEITSIKSSRGRRTMTVTISPDASLDELETYSDTLCEFEVGMKVRADDGAGVDAFTGELIE